MPPTLEVKCSNEQCALDMVELHFTYELVGAHAEEFNCPYCGKRTLIELSYTYEDSQ